MASLSLTATETTITARVTGMDTSHAYTRNFHWNIGTSESNREYDGSSTSAPHAGSTSYTFTGLSPKTKYYILVDVMDHNDEEWFAEFTGSITTAGLSLAYWSWTSSNGSASNTQTRNAYTALTTGGPVSDFSYRVWNDFVDKINECRKAAGYGWSEYYLSLDDTKMSSGDKMMTAYRFNSAKENIGSLYSTGIYYPPNNKPYVDSGDPVRGRYFTDLTDVLNEWIESLNNA